MLVCNDEAQIFSVVKEWMTCWFINTMVTETRGTTRRKIVLVVNFFVFLKLILFALLLP